MTIKPLLVAATVLILHTCCLAAAWHDADSPFRRSVTLEQAEAKITGEELASARLLLNGRQLPDAADLHVTTVQGKPVPYRVIPRGGDEFEVAFNTAKAAREYHVYFGGKTPRKPPAEPLNKGGLLLEVKAGANQAGSSHDDLKNAFERAGRPVGQRLIPSAHLGNNLVGHGGPCMTRLTGHLFAPLEGTYVIALAGDDRAALWIDGKHVVFARQVTNDARFQERVALTRGWHEFALYHVDFGGEYTLGVYWRRPDMDKFDVVGREFFGMVLQADAGPLEHAAGGISADLRATYLGESFYANRFSHRYRFDVASSVRNLDRVQVKWQLSDGRTVTGQQFEHVFLRPGTHEVRVEVRSGGNTDTQSYRLHIDRDYERADRPPLDELGLHAKLVASYDLATLTPESLASAIQMFLRASMRDHAYKAGAELAARAKHPNRLASQEALGELLDDAMDKGDAGQVEKVFAAAPSDSELNPRLAVEHANLLLYASADFARARNVIAPHASADAAARRTHAQALLLTGELAKAQSILSALPVNASEQKAQALSGAMARTTEYHVREKQAAFGEEAWEKWMAAFPADFLDGNAALLRVQLIEIRKQPAAAAKVAEAYANGNPQSAYAPRLLHEAARLLQPTDAAKAAQLRDLLRQRYPEDPLSQQK